MIESLLHDVRESHVLLETLVDDLGVRLDRWHFSILCLLTEGGHVEVHGFVSLRSMHERRLIIFRQTWTRRVVPLSISHGSRSLESARVRIVHVHVLRVLDIFWRHLLLLHAVFDEGIVARGGHHVD